MSTYFVCDQCEIESTTFNTSNYGNESMPKGWAVIKDKQFNYEYCPVCKGEFMDFKAIVKEYLDKYGDEGRITLADFAGAAKTTPQRWADGRTEPRDGLKKEVIEFILKQN